LRPFDVFEIQTAIDNYERRHPRRATPSAEVALAWSLGWRGRARVPAGANLPQTKENQPRQRYRVQKRRPVRLEGEVGRLRWAYESFLVWWLVH
jgi:hypothetical protein